MPSFILGPSKWQNRYTPKIPDWVGDFLPTLWARRGRKALSPLDVRAALAEAVRREGMSATIMEAHASRTGEAHTSLFNRIVRDIGIDTFIVYWPARAQRTGVDVELGFLLQWLEGGRDVDARVLVESAAGRITAGRFESFEHGRRSRYYEDLVSFGCPIIEWADYGELWLALRHHAR